jgi:hypothetical protein
MAMAALSLYLEKTKKIIYCLSMAAIAQAQSAIIQA